MFCSGMMCPADRQRRRPRSPRPRCLRQRPRLATFAFTVTQWNDIVIRHFLPRGGCRMNKSNIVSAFSEEQTQRLTGVTVAQLRYWDRTNFFTPSLADENRRRPYGRVYSFQDLVCLKILNTLRNEARVSLPHLREVKDKLAHLGDDMWARTTLYVLNRKVVFDNPDTRQREEIVSGQGVLQIPLQVVQSNMERAVKELWKRDKATVGKIQRTPGIASNKPVVAGTRIPVSAIKAFREAGYTIEQIREQYPVLTDVDIRAALKHGEAA
jgi:uncharacterized protein (DUF433 family)